MTDNRPVHTVTSAGVVRVQFDAIRAADGLWVFHDKDGRAHVLARWKEGNLHAENQDDQAGVLHL